MICNCLLLYVNHVRFILSMPLHGTTYEKTSYLPITGGEQCLETEAITVIIYSPASCLGPVQNAVMARYAFTTLWALFKQEQHSLHIHPKLSVKMSHKAQYNALHLFPYISTLHNLSDILSFFLFYRCLFLRSISVSLHPFVPFATLHFSVFPQQFFSCVIYLSQQVCV